MLIELTLATWIKSEGTSDIHSRSMKISLVKGSPLLVMMMTTRIATVLCLMMMLKQQTQALKPQSTTSER